MSKHPPKPKAPAVSAPPERTTRSVYPILPDGHKLKGVSSLQKVVDPETGETVMQWVKTAAEVERREQLCKEVIDALKEKAPRLGKAPAPKAKNNEQLANLHVVTDYHLGMLAWGEESGADWDLKIAEQMLLDLFAYSLKSAPNATHGILCQLGDFLHYDSFESVTPTSRHLLDSDTRPQKMVRVAVRVLRRVIDMMLRKYNTVHVLMAEGNHDIMASAWLREIYAVMYENEPRISVETRPDPYYAHVWGDTVLFFHHGHLKKMAGVDVVFARKFREDYGNSKFAYGHMGHLHHSKVLETTLMEVEQHPTLAAQDSYASRGGWLSQRVAKVITYHKQFGEVGRTGITPEMLQSEQND